MPPPGGKNKEAEKRFANFMTSTAGGTQGSSTYSGPPSGSSSDGGGGSQSQQDIINQAQENFRNQQKIQQDFDDKQEKEKKRAQEIIDQNKGGLDDVFEQFSLFAKVAPTIEAGLDKFFGKNIDESILSDPNKLAILEARLRRGDLGKGEKTLEDELFKEGGEYFDLLNEIYADELKDPEMIEKFGKGLTAEDILRGRLETAAKTADPNITYRFDEEAAKEKFKNTPMTTGGKVDLANLPTTGPNAIKDPELRRKIFEAREFLQSNQGGNRNPFTGNPTDSGGGIPSVNTGGGSQTDTDTTDPGFPDYRFRDLGIAPFASYNPDDVMVDFSNYQATRGPLSSITNAKDGGIMRAADGAMVSISMTPLPITNIQEIKMDKQKYRDNMIREEIARSSMAKDVDLAPNFSMDA